MTWEEEPDPPCRMVPMRLIPDNGETMDQFRNIIHVWFPDLNDWGNLGMAEELVAALDGETP